MPRMSDHEEFLNATMVKNGDILVLLDAGVFREPEDTGFQRTVFQIRVGLPDQRAKTWTMNKTTRNRLAQAWGDNSESWIQKGVRIQILQQNVRGEVKQVVYGYPSETPPQQASMPQKLPAQMPGQAAPPASQQAGLPPNVSDLTRMWLKYNEKIIGGVVDAEDYNAMEKTVRDELASIGWLFMKDDAPHLSEDARQALG